MDITNKRGFSLLELILVLGVGTAMGFIKLQDMKHNQENIIAQAVGSQIKQMGEAVNRYISIRYDKLSTLTSSSSQSSDPGPRTCSATGCEITYQTLVNEGLLPSTYTGVNAQKSAYKILLRRSGTLPNYVINGLITTTTPWEEGGGIRYDLLGKAMQAAGIDSGISQSKTQVSGYNGSWSEKSTDYSSINKTGLLAYHVGYDSSMYSVYLRRDGTLPMTGNLNMGGQSIYNAQDITAAGATTSSVFHSIGNTNVGMDLTVGGNAQVNGNINSNITISGTTVTSRGETYTQNWFRTLGAGGIYFQKYGGGWNMSDANTIQAYGGKNIQTSAGVYGGYVKSSGNIDASGNITSAATVSGQYLQPTSVSTVGGYCSSNGLMSKDGQGKLLTCQSGRWTGLSNFPAGIPVPWPVATPPAGWLACNGQAFDKGVYPQLAKAYPTGYLPDLRGVFIRGWDNGRGFDNGRTLLSYQKDQSDMTLNTGGRLEGHHNGMDHYYKQGAEVRPKNVAFSYIVKAE